MTPDAPNRSSLEALLKDQAAAVDMNGDDPAALWASVIETESALITDGLHVVGQPMDDATLASHLQMMDFADDYRSYVINYGLGQEMVKTWIEAQGDSPVWRWKAMERLLSEPILPDDLAVPAP